MSKRVGKLDHLKLVVSNTVERRKIGTALQTNEPLVDKIDWRKKLVEAKSEKELYETLDEIKKTKDESAIPELMEMIRMDSTDSSKYKFQFEFDNSNYSESLDDKLTSVFDVVKLNESQIRSIKESLKSEEDEDEFTYAVCASQIVRDVRLLSNLIEEWYKGKDSCFAIGVTIKANEKNEEVVRQAIELVPELENIFRERNKDEVEENSFMLAEISYAVVKNHREKLVELAKLITEYLEDLEVNSSKWRFSEDFGMEHEDAICGIAGALGEIDYKQAIPVLIRILMFLQRCDKGVASADYEVEEALKKLLGGSKKEDRS
ncbi:MAG: hypothetical protein AABX38_00590 [Candidatus Micrarchaeota archaeon]